MLLQRPCVEQTRVSRTSRLTARTFSREFFACFFRDDRLITCRREKQACQPTFDTSYTARCPALLYYIIATRHAVLLLSQLLAARPSLYTVGTQTPSTELAAKQNEQEICGVLQQMALLLYLLKTVSMPPAHLPRLLCQAAHDSVAVWPAGRAIILVLHNHSLLSSVAAGEEHNDLVWLCTAQRTFSHLVHAVLLRSTALS